MRIITTLLLAFAIVHPADARTVALALSGGGARGLAHVGLFQVLEEEGLEPDLIVGTSMGAVIGGLYAAGYSAAELKAMALSTDWSDLLLDRPARRNLFLGRKETQARHILSLRFHGWVPEVPNALSGGQRASDILFTLVHRAPYQPWPSFDDLRIPFRAVATDLVTGESVVFSRGDLAEAMRATVSLPLVFAPYRLDTLLLVDGGVIENIPVEAARHQGADIVIGVDVSTGIEGYGLTEMPWELADRVTTIMHQQRNAQSRALADVVITPDLGTYRSTDFGAVSELIEAGYRAAREKLPELRAAFARSDSLPSGPRAATFCSHQTLQDFLAHASPGSLPPTGYRFAGVTSVPESTVASLPAGPDGLAKLDLLRRTYMDRGRVLAHATALWFDSSGALCSHWEEGRIRRLSVSGLLRHKPWTVLYEFPLEKGQAFDVRRARRGLTQIYGTDLFESVALSAMPSDSGAELTLRVRERESPQLRLGAGYSLERRGRGFAEFLNDNLLNLGARLTLFGKYGELDEEVRAGVTFDRPPFRLPLERLLQTNLVVDMSGGWKRSEFNFYTLDHRDTAFYFFERTTADLWLGTAFRRWGEISAGARYEAVRAGGVLDEPTAQVTYLGVRTRVDTKDRYPFPTSGLAFLGRYEYALKSRQTGRAFNRTEATAEAYVPLHRRIVVHGRSEWAWNDRLLPLWAQFPIGGENCMLGLHTAERYGSAKLCALTEVRYDLISRWLADAYVSALYTVGAVSAESEPLPLASDYQHGLGGSFALSTFLGPMSFTVSRLLRSPVGKEQTLIYLNLGHEF